MIRLHNIRVKITPEIDLENIVASKLNVNKDKIKKVIVHKKSIDARCKKYFSYVYDLDVLIKNENKYLKNGITKVLDENYHLPDKENNKKYKQIVIVGLGPAGLFCGYMLAKYGYKPIIIDRGESVDKRVKTVNELWQENIFNDNSNVQFGEGGAGTFSDGKLNTLVNDKKFMMREVFKIFVECGAPREIMYESKPHIGTDILRNVVKNIREKIINYGGIIKYNSLLEDIVIEDESIKGIVVNKEFLECDLLVLAIGHSARDTFKMLYNKKISMITKPFAVGVRIIHPQEMINNCQYPINYAFLPPASYKLTYKAKNNRGVYSFCMCPGGYVVNARSTKNGICTNGMSNYKRESSYANSAIIVTVSENDFPSNVLGGITFQENIERKAFQLTQGAIAVQRYIDYKNNNESKNEFPHDAFKGNVKSTNINEIFPDFINTSLKDAIDHFNNLIPGFNGSDAFIAAPEMRSSSPVRIIRDELLESNIKGIYPCGEGAGYAGGITTSAMDGIKVFESIYKNYQALDKKS